MTNINRQSLTSKDYQLAYTQLITLIANLNKKQAHYLMDELLTEAEHIMLTKRFAAALMFSHSYSPYRVSNILGLSLSTSQRIYKHYQESQFDHLVQHVPKKEINAFLSLIHDLIVAQASPRARARIFNKAAKTRR